MIRPFDDTTRRNIAELCAISRGCRTSEPAPALKRAAVAIVLVEAGCGRRRHRASADPARLEPAQPSRPMGTAGRPLRRGRNGGRAALRELHEELGARARRAVCSDCSTITRPARLPDYAGRGLGGRRPRALSPNPAEVASVPYRAFGDRAGRRVQLTAIPESDAA